MLNERKRLKALKSYKILDSAAEKAYDDLTQIASIVCGVPISLISLVDQERQWFKSKVGLEVDETPVEQAFCKYTILSDKLLIIPDATQDSRTAKNPLVTGNPNIRFYAGAPLVTADGFVLGSLCVIDRKPRELDDSQLEILKRLSNQVVYLMEYRRVSRKLSEALEEIQNYRKVVPICGHCKSIRSEDGHWYEFENYVKQISVDFSHSVCPNCFETEYNEL
ncbi:MAG: GAF domain-containing protein [Sumerlaeia bacterium]